MNIHIKKGIRQADIKKIVRWTNTRNSEFLRQYAGDKWSFPLSEMQVSEEQDRVHIGRFLLNPNKTGKGIGTEALNNFCKILFNEGKIGIITLNVAEFNKSARRCYEKCGFTVYDERYKNGNRTLKMWLVRTK